MAGVCHEDAGLMPHQEGVRQRSAVRYKAQRSTANSMTGSSEARSVGNRVSTWMGGCSQGPISDMARLTVILQDDRSLAAASHPCRYLRQALIHLILPSSLLCSPAPNTELGIAIEHESSIYKTCPNHCIHCQDARFTVQLSKLVVHHSPPHSMLEHTAKDGPKDA